MQTLDRLESGQALVSLNGEFELEMRRDGDLVETALGQTFFSTHTQGHPGAYLVDQSDGNLVLRSAAGNAIWASNRRSIGKSTLTVEDTGELVQLGHAGSRLWTVAAPNLTTLGSGERLTASGAGAGRYTNQSLATFVGGKLHLTLTMQRDGNLVSRVSGVAKWTTGTVTNPPGWALMQPDGDFVVYDGFGRAVWSTGTYGNPGARLVLQASDGNVVVYSATDKPLWSIATGRIG